MCGRALSGREVARYPGGCGVIGRFPKPRSVRRWLRGHRGSRKPSSCAAMKTLSGKQRIIKAVIIGKGNSQDTGVTRGHGTFKQMLRSLESAV